MTIIALSSLSMLKVSLDPHLELHFFLLVKNVVPYVVPI